MPLSAFYSQWQAELQLIWLHSALTPPSDKTGIIFTAKLNCKQCPITFPFPLSNSMSISNENFEIP